MHAVSEGKIEAVNLILRYLTPSDVNARDRGGRTALHYAAARVISGATLTGLSPSTSAGTPMNTAIDILQSLIEVGQASPAIPNASRVTVLQMMQEAPEPLRRDPRIVRLFPSLDAQSQLQQPQQRPLSSRNLSTASQQHPFGQGFVAAPATSRFGTTAPDTPTDGTHTMPSESTSSPPLFSFPREAAQGLRIWQLRSRYLQPSPPPSEALKITVDGHELRSNPDHATSQTPVTSSKPTPQQPQDQPSQKSTSRKQRPTSSSSHLQQQQQQQHAGRGSSTTSELSTAGGTTTIANNISEGTSSVPTRTWTTLPYTFDPDEGRLHQMLSKIHPDFSDYLAVFDMLKKFRAQREAKRQSIVQADGSAPCDANKMTTTNAHSHGDSVPGSPTSTEYSKDSPMRGMMNADSYEGEHSRSRKDHLANRYLTPEDLRPLFNFISGLDASGRSLNKSRAKSSVIGMGSPLNSPLSTPGSARSSVSSDGEPGSDLFAVHPQEDAEQLISDEAIKDVLELIDISRDGKVDAQDFWLAMAAPFVPRSPEEDVDASVSDGKHIPADAFEGTQGLDDVTSAAIAANRLSESGLSVPEIVAALAHDRAVKRAAAAEADQLHTVDIPFSLFDRDGDGLITVDDLRNVRSMLGVHLFPLITSNDMTNALEVLSAGFNYTYGGGGGSGMSIHCTAQQSPQEALAVSSQFFPPTALNGGNGTHVMYDQRPGVDSPVPPVPEPLPLPNYSASEGGDMLTAMPTPGNINHGHHPRDGVTTSIINARRHSRITPPDPDSYCTRAAFGALVRSQVPVLSPSALSSKNALFFLSPETAVKARLNPTVSAALPPVYTSRNDSARMLERSRSLRLTDEQNNVQNPEGDPSSPKSPKSNPANSQDSTNVPSASPTSTRANRRGSVSMNPNTNPYFSRRRSITTPESSLMYSSLAEVGLARGGQPVRRGSIASPGSGSTKFNDPMSLTAPAIPSNPSSSSASSAGFINPSTSSSSTSYVPSFGNWITRRSSVSRGRLADAGTTSLSKSYTLKNLKMKRPM